jgi:hypothetical protein
LSGFGDPGSRLDGFLIYPEDDSGEVARRVSPNNPWRVSSAPERNLWFVSAGSSENAEVTTVSDGEQLVTNLVRAAIAV